MKYKKTFKLFKYKEDAEKFIKIFLKNKKYTITQAQSKDNSFNFVVWYFE